MMELWSFLLLGLGLVLVMLEVFFPSFGLLGTLAAGCVIGGGVVAYQAESDIFGTYLMTGFVLIPSVAVLALKLFPKTPFGKKMTLAGSSFDPDDAAAGANTDLVELVGKTGIARTPLRPAGKALVDGNRIDVLTRGELISTGKPVKVIRVEGNRVFVAEDQG